jgi:biotin carboxyl carrier protein
MKRYEITLDGRTFDILLLSDPRQEEVQVEVDGRPLTVKVKAVPVAQETTETAPSPAAAASRVTEAVAPSVRSVNAPLPGIVKMIAVQSNQRVAKGDTLIVIEAMKMNNIIRAPREGAIGTILVAEGHQVAHGEPLLEYRD